ncbi:MAG: hypothetical protein RR138_07795 [Akkermansia sp.]
MQITINKNEVSITMDAELEKKIESEAKEAGMTVEEFLASGTMRKVEELFPL